MPDLSTFLCIHLLKLYDTLMRRVLLFQHGVNYI